MPSTDRARTATQALSRRGQAAPIDIASNHGQSITGDLMEKAWWHCRPRSTVADSPRAPAHCGRMDALVVPADPN